MPELTVEELVAAIKEYTRNACTRTDGYDEDISNPFLRTIDFAVAEAAGKAISALFVQLETEKKDFEVKNQEFGRRIDALKGGGPPKQSAATDLDDDIPF